MDAKTLKTRLAQMEADRSEHVEVWRKCYQYSYPSMMGGFYNEQQTAQESLDYRSELYDSTTTEAVRTFASTLIDGMTPSNALWFDLDAGDESDDERAWLSKAARFIWENIHNSNFDSVAFEAMIHSVCSGWFVMFIDERESGGYHFELWPIAQCFIASSRPGERIDIIIRKYKLTAIQAVSYYGEKEVSSNIRKAIEENKPNEKFEFCNYIGPRKNHVSGSRLAKNLPFESVHMEVNSGKIVKESGYHEFPCAVPRWSLIQGSQYALGPVFDVLPDAVTINKIKEYELANLDLAIGGLWIAEDDGVLNARNIKIGPRRVIVANSVDSMKPLQSSADFNVAFMSEDRIQQQIRKVLMADILPPLEGQPRTAAEIHMRQQHIRQMHGPAFGRLMYEYLQVVVERCFGIAYRAGVLGQPPETLANRNYVVRYVSPLARAQKLAEVNAIDQYVEGLGIVSQIDPSVMDNIDLDKAARYRGKALGVPADLIPSVNDISEKRAAREQQQQQAQQEQIGAAIQQEAGIAAAKQAVGA